MVNYKLLLIFIKYKRTNYFMKTNKQTIEIRRKIVFFFMSFTLCLMQSCSTEEVELSTASTVVGQLKNDLKLDQFAKKNFAENIVINWETINTIEKNGVTVYEIPISEIQQTTIASNLFQEQLKYGLIAVKKGDEMRSYLIEAFSSVKHSLYANTIQNLEKFTGTLNVYELNGGLVGQLVVFNGKSTNPSSNNYLAPLDEAINLFYVSKNTTSRVPSCNITQFVQIINQHEVRHHVPTVIVGTYTNWGYSYSTFTRTTTGTYMSIPYPCGSDADYHHVPYRVTTHEDVYDDPCKKIKAQIDNVVIKAKIDALKGKTANKNEAGIVQKKDGTFADMQAATNSNELNMPPGTDFIGSMHTHQDPYPSGRYRPDGSPIMLRPIPIFSPKDVVQFLEFLNNTKNNNSPITDVYSTMISSSAVYQLRFTGNITDVKIDFDYEILNEKYRVAIRENKEELGFLKFLKDNININGIELYEIKDDGSTNKFFLDSDNKITSAPCQ